ncbi:PIN domain-containing protein [Paenibacillus sp. YYML68]|uniref:PIN domain-containing protein n=1 Tax=Paenibacillus sp. YYML68 TaxID=2909250 RepID=UPI002492A4A1|nr:PIN domain-containing protein [Paenibacillus sp. YYML68]
MESNFILELVLAQEEATAAEQILDFAEINRIKLVIPTFSLMEPFWTIQGRGKQRKSIQQSLNKELQQLQRSVYNQELVSVLQPLTKTIIDVEIKERDMLEKVLGRLLRVGETIDITSTIYEGSIRYQEELDLSPQDAIIYSSVITNVMQQSVGEEKVFVSRNWKDFEQEEILEELQNYKCKFFSNFHHALGYIQSRL